MLTTPRRLVYSLNNPHKILKNCSSVDSYETSKICCPRNQICAKNNPLKVIRPYNSPTVPISTQSRGG